MQGQFSSRTEPRGPEAMVIESPASAGVIDLRSVVFILAGADFKTLAPGCFCFVRLKLGGEGVK